MLELDLEKIGLSKNEVAIYLALVELGKARAGAIIEYTGLHRNIVYTALESLEYRKLATKLVAGKVFVFVANGIEALLGELDEKKELVQTAMREIKKRTKQKPNTIAIYEGVEGRKTVRNKMLDMPKGETIYVMGGSGISTAPELETYWRSFHKKRIKKGIKQRIFFDQSTPKEMMDWRNALPITSARYLPFSAELPFDITICKDLVELGVYGKQVLTFSLRNKELVNGFKKYFDYFWNQENYVLRGPETLQQIWLESIDTGTVKQIGPRGYFVDRYPELFKPIVEKMKRTPGAVWKFICEPNMRGHEVTKFPWTQTKYNLTSSKNLNVIWLWSNKAAVVNWAEDEPIIFVSENKHLVQSYSDYFDELWNKKGHA